MFMGSLTLACTLLLADAGPQDPAYMAEGKFAIPIRLNPDKRADVRELLLYVSRDNGKVWELQGRARPDQDQFPFYAPRDGSYWFAIAAIDRNGKQDPVDIYTAPVGLKVVVDTRKPEVRINRAERRGDEVIVAWDVRDDNPDLNSFRLEYRDAASPNWAAVNATPALQGETSFRVLSGGPVKVRLVVSDLAANIGQTTQDVSATGVAAPPPFEQANAAPGAVLPPPGAGEMPVPVQPLPAAAVPAPEFRQAPVAANEPAPRPYTRPADEVPPARQFASQPAQIPADPARQTLAQSTDQARPTLIQTGSSSTVPDRMAATAPTQSAYTPRGPMPPVEIVNKRQPRITFQVGKYGPSGLGSVDVYQTTDDGATWALSPGDHNVTMPSPTEMRGGSAAAVSVMVDLKDEGVVYGYYVVVKSRAGLGIKPPEPGTTPQVRLELDVSAPIVELYVPQPDPNHRDALMLTWKATDAHLATNPVTMEWAERIDGQWNLIGTAEMANTGQFSWQVPVNIPPSVFLRLAVRDVAGNSAVAQTREPVVVDLNVPEPAGFKVTK